jgi:sugar lactone lactonase YvrE
VDLGYDRIADPYDAKFHRSLVRWKGDGCLYAAIALLHDVDHYWDAPGGAIVRYDPHSGEMHKIGIPLPHVYIQSICLDQERGVLYGITFTPERMFRFDLPTGRADDLGPIGSGLAMAQGENVELDGEGNAWCGWGVTRAWQDSPGADSHRLCKFDPRTGQIRFFDAGLPNPDGSYGYTKVEGLFYLGQGRLYASGGNGSLYRVDTETGMGTYLGTPVPDRPSRLASLRLGPDGAAYGVTGREGRCEVIRFDPRTETYELLGPVVDGGLACWQVHDVAVTPDAVLYAGENDNPYRSGYLWEIAL